MFVSIYGVFQKRFVDLSTCRHFVSDNSDKILPKHLVIPNIFTNFASMNLNSMMKHYTNAKQDPL